MRLQNLRSTAFGFHGAREALAISSSTTGATGGRSAATGWAGVVLLVRGETATSSAVMLTVAIGSPRPQPEQSTAKQRQRRERNRIRRAFLAGDGCRRVQASRQVHGLLYRPSRSCDPQQSAAAAYRPHFCTRDEPGCSVGRREQARFCASFLCKAWLNHPLPAQKCHFLHSIF